MLDTFFGAIRPEESLCFFYAKRTPLSEQSRRVIVGVGRTRVANLAEFQRATEGAAAFVLQIRRGSAVLVIPIR